MNITIKAGLASAIAATTTIALATSVHAADLYRGGSLKDGYAPVHQAAPSIAGPCYLRGDVGYSWSGDPTANYVGNGTDPKVHGASLDNGAVWEAGIGCGSGSRGLRGDITVGFRTDRDFKGDVDIIIPNVGPIDPPIKTTLDTYTVMLNGYYDLGNYRGFVPYVGAGVGIAMHRMGYVQIDHPASPNPQDGDTRAEFAWALMAGVGYQVTSNAILDIGYRYIDMGSAHSSRTDMFAQQFAAWNPKLVVDDIDAHEFKVGLRYHFGSSSDCCGYAPMK
ncbi:MAG: outer membrane beta-barrel protein [Hyphomicrobiaceae bacterium]|nr:outer membrane beta-barrel protein [Hyphomicrobiaceae bacterium]